MYSQQTHCLEAEPVNDHRAPLVPLVGEGGKIAHQELLFVAGSSPDGVLAPIRRSSHHCNYSVKIVSRRCRRLMPRVALTGGVGGCGDDGDIGPGAPIVLQRVCVPGSRSGRGKEIIPRHPLAKDHS
jgi:hypothetical protein